MVVLPKPFAGELLGSILVRAARQENCGLGKILIDLMGSRRRLNLLAAGPLGALAQHSWVDAQALYDRHTLAPYALASLEASQRSRHVDALMAPAQGPRTAAALQPVTEFVRYRRYCSLCVREDMAYMGVSYYRREHHLPLAVMCPKHRVPLHQTGTPVLRCNSDLLPSEEAGVPMLGSRVFGDVLEIQERLAAIGQRALKSPQAVVQLCSAQTLRAELTGRGLLDSRHNVSTVALERWLVSKLGPSRARAQERLQGWGVPARLLEFNWLALAVRPSGSGYVPLALRMLLLACITSTRHSEWGPLTLAQVSPGAPRLDRRNQDAAWAEALKVEIAQWKAQAHSAGFKDLRPLLGRSPGQAGGLQLPAGSEFMRRIGAWGQYRHDPGAFPRLRRVFVELMRLREQGYELRRKPSKWASLKAKRREAAETNRPATEQVV